MVSMNSNTPDSVGQQPIKKKRKWWVYALIALGALVVLVISVVVGLALYFNSLVKTYAQNQPIAFPQVDTSKEAMKQLRERFAAFQLGLTTRRGAVQPFELTPEDLDVSVANMAGLKDRMHFVVENNQLKAKFCFPMDNPKQSKDKARFLNGEATVKLKLENGFLNASVGSITANGKPLPTWMASRIQKQNLVDFFNRNYDTLEFFQNLDAIEVRDGAVVLTPYVGQ